MKKNKLGRITLPESEAYHTAATIKTGWHWRRERHAEHWSRRERSETDPHHTQPTEVQKARRWRKDCLSTNGAGRVDIRRQKINCNLNLTPCTKLNSNCIRDLSVKCKIIKLLGK